MATRKGSDTPPTQENGKLFEMLVGEMEKYKGEEEGQAELIERLRQKVHNFLYSEETNLDTSQNNRSLPNIKPNSNNSQSKIKIIFFFQFLF